MGTLLSLAGLYLFIKIVGPLILLALVVYFAYRWANPGGGGAEFQSAEPEDRERF